MVCPKLTSGFCEVLKAYCEKPYELKMGMKPCPVLKGKTETKVKKEKKGKKKTSKVSKVKKAKGKKGKKKKK